MAEEEKQTLLPIYHRNDHNDQLADKDAVDNDQLEDDAVVINVKCNLKKLLTESVGVDEFGSTGESIKPLIYRIPKFMKDIQPKAFEPQLVSFGPYHHGEEHLAPMEQEKKKVFRHFVKRVSYESIVSNVSNILEDLYGAYDNLDHEKWKKDGGAKFMEMMIIDACFMLVFFLEKEDDESLITLKSDIKRDILLLENQLPFQLLQLLYDILPTPAKNKSLTLLISNLMFLNKNEAVIRGKGHILEMYRASLLSIPPIDPRRRDQSKKKEEIKKDGKKDDKKDDDEFGLKLQIIPQATLLHEAGITFQQSKTKGLNDVSFDLKQGVLKLPCLIVDDDTETNLLNVMAFEKLHPDVRRKVTSFVVLMNNLIDKDKDVELLSTDNIIANALGNDEDAANLFSVLGKGAAMDLDDNITEVHRLVNEHCDKSWNKWCASLKHNYFQNPWAIISLLAAIFAFAIVIVQAVYQIVEFHTRK